MSKLFTFILAGALMLMSSGIFAQCTINNANTTVGFTPTSPPCIRQGVAYGQTVQVHIPPTQSASVVTLTVDSVRLLSLTGMPAGITVQGNPSDSIIHGGGNGCLWFSGTTNAAAATYPITITIRLWTSYSGTSVGPRDTTLAAIGYPFSLTVCTATDVPAESPDKAIKLYPNPASDMLNIERAESTEAEMVITDISGKEIRKYSSNVLTSVLDIHDLAAGSYLFRVTDKQTRQAQTLRFNKF